MISYNHDNKESNVGVLLDKLKSISEDDDEVVADPVKIEVDMWNIVIYITYINNNKKSNAGFLLDDLKTGMSEDVDDDNLVAERIMEEFTDQEEQV